MHRGDVHNGVKLIGFTRSGGRVDDGVVWLLRGLVPDKTHLAHLAAAGGVG